jgi:hypothetical protein
MGLGGTARVTPWLTISFVLVLGIGSAVLSVQSAPVRKPHSSGRSFHQPDRHVPPHEDTNLSSMLLNSTDFGPGVQSVTAVPASAKGGAVTPPCLFKASNWDSRVAGAGAEIDFDSGNDLLEDLGAFANAASAHRAFSLDVRALDSCHKFDRSEDGQTLSYSVSPGLPQMARQGDEWMTYRFTITGDGAPVGLDLILVRKGGLSICVYLSVPSPSTHRYLKSSQRRHLQRSVP